MNKKGDMDGLGTILVTFIVILVGVVLLIASAQLVGDTTNTIDVVNESVPSANGTTLANLAQLQGKFVTDVVVYNSSDDLIVAEGNYTILQNQVINGVETAGLNITAVDDVQPNAWNVSYTYQPTTYISNSGGRSIAGIIIIFFALAILVISLVPTLRNKILDVR